MRRRRFISVVATVGVAGAGGCAALGRSDTVRESATVGGADSRPIAEHGVPADICESDPSDDPGIYAVDDPATASNWDGLDPDDRYGQLTDDTTVVGIERAETARAYPLSVLWWHEIVNDDMGGPVVVTYCPLCRSGMVAEGRVDGSPARFEVTGLLWVPPRLQTRINEDEGRAFGVERSSPRETEIRNNGNLVMIDDRTGSFWSQLLAQAICGPQQGNRLTVVPSSTATWREWRRTHPETDVLLPPPRSGTVEG